MRVWKNKNENLKELLLADKEVMKSFSKKEVEELFDLEYHLKHVNTIFKRVLPKEC